MKKISTLILAIAFCTLLVGCGNKEKNIVSNKININQNGQNSSNNNSVSNTHDYNEGGTNANDVNVGENLTKPEDIVVEVTPIEIKTEENTMTVSVFGLYTLVYTFEGEKVIGLSSEYSFYSELALNEFVEEQKNKSSNEIVVDGMKVTVISDASEYENLTKTEVINEYEELKRYYENIEQ